MDTASKTFPTQREDQERSGGDDEGHVKWGEGRAQVTRVHSMVPFSKEARWLQPTLQALCSRCGMRDKNTKAHEHRTTRYAHDTEGNSNHQHLRRNSVVSLAFAFSRHKNGEERL